MGYSYENLSINIMTGLTMVRVERLFIDKGDVIEFEDDTGQCFRLYHDQDCCENVYIEDIDCDLQDLVGNPLLLAEEVSNLEHQMLGLGPLSDVHDSYTWTYYKLYTIKGGVHIRWYGSSNGYYSERVNFKKMETGYDA